MDLFFALYVMLAMVMKTDDLTATAAVPADVDSQDQDAALKAGLFNASFCSVAQ